MNLDGPHRWGDLRGVLTAVQAGAESATYYRTDLLTSLVGVAVRVGVVVVVWRAAYGGRDLVAGIDVATATSYAVLAVCLQAVLVPAKAFSLAERIRSGDVAVDLTRPQPLLVIALARHTGAMAAHLPHLVVGVLVGQLVGVVRFPRTPASWAASLTAVVLGAVIALLMNLLVSMMAFWTVDITGTLLVYQMVFAYASGALVPLWFMPGTIRDVLEILPFQAQVQVPLTLWFGVVDASGTWRALGLQAAWVLVLSGVVWVAWLRATRRMVIFGG